MPHHALGHDGVVTIAMEILLSNMKAENTYSVKLT